VLLRRQVRAGSVAESGTANSRQQQRKFTEKSQP
jgi:hypothetical protein